MQDFADDRIDRVDACVSGPERRGQRAVVTPKIPGALNSAVKFIVAADILAPADDLAYEAFERVQGNVISARMLEGSIKDLAWREQPWC